MYAFIHCLISLITHFISPICNHFAIYDSVNNPNRRLTYLFVFVWNWQTSSDSIWKVWNLISSALYNQSWPRRPNEGRRSSKDCTLWSRSFRCPCPKREIDRNINWRIEMLVIDFPTFIWRDKTSRSLIFQRLQSTQRALNNRKLNY
jgi:hypothetical protein